jgi:hypothetical protein
VGTVELSEEDADLVGFELRLAPAAEPGAKTRWELSTGRAAEPDAAPADAASGAQVPSELPDSTTQEVGIRGFRLRMQAPIPEESAATSETPAGGEGRGDEATGSGDAAPFQKASAWPSFVPRPEPDWVTATAESVEEAKRTAERLGLQPSDILNPPPQYVDWTDWAIELGVPPSDMLLPPQPEFDPRSLPAEPPTLRIIFPAPANPSEDESTAEPPSVSPIYFGFEAASKASEAAAEPGASPESSVFTRTVNWEAVLLELGDGEPPLDPAALVPVAGGSSQGIDLPVSPRADIYDASLSERTTQWLRQLNWTSFSIQRQKPTVDDIIASIRAQGYGPQEESGEAREQHPLADPIRAAEAMAGWVAPGDRDPSPKVYTWWELSWQGTFEGVDADKRAVDPSVDGQGEEREILGSGPVTRREFVHVDTIIGTDFVGPDPNAPNTIDDLEPRQTRDIPGIFGSGPVTGPLFHVETGSGTETDLVGMSETDLFGMSGTDFVGPDPNAPNRIDDLEPATANVSEPSGKGTFEGVDADERAVNPSRGPTTTGGDPGRSSSGSLVDLLTHPLRSVRSVLTLAALLAAVVVGAVFLSQGGGGESSLTTTPGQSSAAQTSPGQTSPGQTSPGQTSPGQTSPSGSSSGGSTSPGAPEGGTPTVRRQTLDSRSVAPQPVTCDTGTPADAPGNQIRLAAIRVDQDTGNPEVEVRFAASQEAAFEGDDSKALHVVAGPNIPEEADSRLAEEHGVFADPANVHYVFEQHLGTVLMGRLQNGVLTPDANLAQIRGDSVFFTIPELDVSAGEHRLLLLAFNSPQLGANPTGPEFCTEAVVTYQGLG